MKEKGKGVQQSNLKKKEFFIFTNEIPLVPFVFLRRRKNSSAASNCQPSEDEPPIIKPVKNKFFINDMYGDLF